MGSVAFQPFCMGVGADRGDCDTRNTVERDGVDLSTEKI